MAERLRPSLTVEEAEAIVAALNEVRGEQVEYVDLGHLWAGQAKLEAGIRRMRKGTETGHG